MSNQQSWTSWLLETAGIGSSGSPAQPPNESARSPTTSQSRDTISSSSPYGPYVRTGRGGAGNFTWQNQEVVQNPSDNVEAQVPPTLNERRKAAEDIEHHDTGAAMKAKAAQRPTSQYVRVGRGFVSSDELQQSSQSADLSERSIVPQITKTPLVAHPGRGGAGNHAAAAELNRLVESENAEKERIKAKETREQVAQQVQSTLPAPPSAWLGDS